MKSKKCGTLYKNEVLHQRLFNLDTSQNQYPWICLQLFFVKLNARDYHMVKTQPVKVDLTCVRVFLIFKFLQIFDMSSRDLKEVNYSKYDFSNRHMVCAQTFRLKS